MDSFELNKVAGAVLGTLLFAFGTGFLAELIYHPKPAGGAGYALPGGGEAEHGGGTEAAAAPKADTVAVRLASADVEKGKAGTKACSACHNFEKDGPNKIGPALWNVVERPKASHAGFDYSASLKEKGGAWTYDDLDHFLESPKGYAKGTKMAFQGIGDAKQRADVILYLHSLSDSPKPLPAAEKKEEGKKEEDKPADAKATEGKAEDKKAESGKADGKKPEGQADQKAGTTADTNAQSGEDAAKKAQPAAPAAGESADTDRPGGSGKAKSQIETGTNPPEAAPAGGSADSKPKAAEETPPKTEAPAKADPAAEKKVQEMKDGTGETKAQ